MKQPHVHPDDVECARCEQAIADIEHERRYGSPASDWEADAAAADMVFGVGL